MPLHEWRVLDLFSGIGGFSLGLERAGMHTVAFCEVNSYCRKVLARHWPDVSIHADVRTLTGTDVENITLICGGFPCQDISTAGQGKGLIEGARSGLWSEYARLIGEIRPAYALMENVPRLLSGGNGEWFATLLADLALCGYDAEWFCLSAFALGAKHVRNRVFILAYRHGDRSPEVRANLQQAIKLMASRHRWTPNSDHPLPHRRQLFTVPNGDIPGGLHGVSDELDRIEALGNAVVPQVAEVIGRALIASREAVAGRKATKECR